MTSHWYYIPLWYIFVSITGYVYGAAKTLGKNDQNKRFERSNNKEE